MPYIKSEKRPVLDGLITTLYSHCDSKGEINYCITKLVHLWVLGITPDSMRPGYDLRSLGHSVLQDAAAEYYREVMGPYEDQKKKVNGPVSELDR